MKVEIPAGDLATLIELARETHELAVEFLGKGLTSMELATIERAEEAIDKAAASHHASVDALEREWASKGVKWSH